MINFAIMPQGQSKYVRLRVIKGSLEVIPDINISISDLNKKGVTKYKHFFNSGYGGITFKVDIIIKDTDKYEDKSLNSYLHQWIRDSTIINVSTNAIDIKNREPKTYLITDNSSRKQEYDHTTTWSLEFTTYKALTVHKYKNDNSRILKALKKMKKGSSSSGKNKVECTKFKNCNIKNLVYSKKKKDVKCVRYLQQILKNNSVYLDGKIDGWYGSDTQGAVGAFQFLNKLKVTGKVDKKTFEKLNKKCGSGKTSKSSTKKKKKKTTKKKKTSKRKKSSKKRYKKRSYRRRSYRRSSSGYQTVNRSRINAWANRGTGGGSSGGGAF